MLASLNNWQKFWMVVGTLGILLVVWVVGSGYVFRPTGLTVVGTGKLSVNPEEVSMIVTRVNTATDVAVGIDDGEAGIDRLMAKAKNMAPDAEIQKSFYQITPQVGGQYIIANALSIKTKSTSQVSSLIKSLYQTGATTVSNVSFTTLNQEATDQQARLLAVKDAKSKAKAIAKSAGKRLGRMVSIADDNTSPQSSVTSGTNIDIIKNVQVVYEIW